MLINLADASEYFFFPLLQALKSEAGRTLILQCIRPYLHRWLADGVTGQIAKKVAMDSLMRIMAALTL